MTRTTSLAGIAAGAILFATFAQAADPVAGKKQFETTCAACHGNDGISIAPIYPDLAGQKEQYLVAQLKAFRDGSRKNAIMQPMAKNLTDTQIANLAAYLSGLRGPSGAPGR